MEILKIHLSANRQGDEHITHDDDSTDVIVYLENGETYSSSFFSYKNIETIKSENKKTGEYLNGKYFWVEGMVLVDDITMETVKEVIQNLIDEGDFRKVFKKL